MDVFYILLVLATLLCSLVAGFLFAFAVVVMPGISQLQDDEYIRSFQVIDGIIQNNQPVFILVWLGSIVLLIAAAVLGWDNLIATDKLLLITSLVVYLAGVQLPTIAINVPLNNKLQTLDTHSMNESELSDEREVFETRWNRWNNLRTILSAFTSTLLLLLMIRL